MALEDLGNPATNDNAGVDDDGCDKDYKNNDDNIDDNYDDDDDKNDDGGTCRTLSPPWTLAKWGGCSPQEASYSRSPGTL